MIFFIFVLLIYGLIILLLVKGVNKLQNKTGLTSERIPVSVIVITYNEENNIQNCIISLINQTYPKSLMEIIIVDDHSTDNTRSIIKKYSDKYKYIKIFPPQKKYPFSKGKYSALYFGIQQATFDVLLFTDADCSPPPGWVEKMSFQLDGSADMIAGFSPQTCMNKKVWNGFLQMDSLAAAFVSAGTIGLGHGFTCTGRNLALKKDPVSKLYPQHTLTQYRFGVDDILLQILSKSVVGYSLNPETRVNAKGPSNFIRFLHQKTRHISAGKHYTLSAQIGYAVFHFTNFLILVSPFFDAYFLLIVTLKIVFDYIALSIFSQKCAFRLNPIYFMIWQVVFPLYHLVVGPFAFLGKTNWKGRTGA
jgi:glycosyltransferase involved in cell wall biosynthesis